MAGMYPDNRTESIFGELVEWPGVDPVTGKFTNGDFSDPFKKPSFVPAETVNLIPDNPANLITAPGGTPDNFSVNQLRDAVWDGIGSSAFIPPATATARGGVRVPGGNGLAMSGDALGMSVATSQEAGAMSVTDKQRLDAMDLRANKYTFIVDSDAALAAWADDAAGNDYSRVLIKAGTWTLRRNITSGSSETPNAFIDISNGRTLSVVGEAGSSIVLEHMHPLANWICGILGMATGTFPDLGDPGTGFFFRDVSVTIRGHSFNNNACFWNCANLSNCAGTAVGSGANNACFRECANLSNCTGTCEGTNACRCFWNCSDLSNCTGIAVRSGNNNVGFHGCTNLSNCTGTGVGTNSSSGFRECANLFNCIGTGVGTGSGTNNSSFHDCRTGFGNRRGPTPVNGEVFDRCFMEQDSGNTPWANTPEGGWNDPSNPGASSLSETLNVPPDAQGSFSADTEASEQDVKSENINEDTPCPEKEAPANGRGLP